MFNPIAKNVLLGWPKHNRPTKTKLKTHVRQLRSKTCPKIHLWAPSKMSYIVVVPMWNSMARSLSSTLGSSILDEWESQIILGPPILKCMKMCKTLKNVGRVVHGRPTLLTITKGGQSSWWTTHEWHLGSNVSSTKYVGDLRMSSYACWTLLVVLG